MHLKRAVPSREVEENRLGGQLQLESLEGVALFVIHDNAPLGVAFVLDVLSS